MMAVQQTKKMNNDKEDNVNDAKSHCSGSSF